MSKHLAPFSGNMSHASEYAGRHRSTDVDDWERQLMEGLAPELSAELAAGILAPPVDEPLTGRGFELGAL